MQTQGRQFVFATISRSRTPITKHWRLLAWFATVLPLRGSSGAFVNQPKQMWQLTQ